jgi:hypothetical protein
MGGWLPDMGGLHLFGLSAYLLPNVLLIWSALAGLAVGLWLRLDGNKRWYAAAALLAYASGAHAASNADVTFGRALLVTAPFRAVSDLQPLMPIAALAIAWWIDRRRLGDILPEHLLDAERTASPRELGTWRAGMARLPDSIFWVDRFVRLRRAYNTERLLGGSEAASLRSTLSELRSHCDNQPQRPGSWRAAAMAWKDNASRVLREPLTIVWIVLTLPSWLWFVVGGWPATAGVQRLLSAGAGWRLVVGLTVAALAWLAWRLLSALPSWRRLQSVPIGEPAAALVLGVTGATGALGFGAFGLLHVSASSMSGLAHASDAFGSLPSSQIFPMANWGAAALPSGGALSGGLAAGGASAAEAEAAAAAAAGATGGSMAAAAAAAGVPVAAGILGAATAIDHAAHLAESSDPEAVSPPGGVPEPLADRDSKSPTLIPNPPSHRPPSRQDTIYAPEVDAPTIPAPPWTSPPTDPRNPVIPRPPLVPREFDVPPSEPAEPPAEGPESQGPETPEPTE